MSLTERDVLELRKEFPLLRETKTMQGKRFCYLDSAATSLRPDCVIEASDSYYRTLGANIHRGDYDMAHRTDTAYSKARETIAEYLDSEADEIVFTSGCTASLNMAAGGLAPLVNPGDRIVLDRAEHASNLLPWFQLAERTGARIVYAPLTDDGRVDTEALINLLNDRAKVVSIAWISNVLGSENDIERICSACRERGIISVVDAAQAISCRAIDVRTIGCDFLAFSGHKVYGPNGIGVLYGRKEMLEKLSPTLTGGGMNARIYPEGSFTLEDIPLRFEAGTPNIPGAIGLAEAIRFISRIGIENIRSWESHLREMLVESIRDIPGITVYGQGFDTPIVSLSKESVPAQDLGTLLNSKGICVRSGLHCAKILTGIPQTGTVRASFGVYTSGEDIEQLIEALREGGDILDAYFD